MKHTFVFIWSIIVTVIATAIMSYICMATPIGPWAEPTILLLGSLLIRFVYKTVSDRVAALGLSTAAAGMGGIIATACAFSFPTLYFLQPVLFNAWLAQPIYFCTIMAALVITASALGLLVAHVVEPTVLSSESMPFSIGQLSHKMIVAQNQIKKSYELFAGMGVSGILVAIQTLFKSIPQAITIIPRMDIGAMHIARVTCKLTTLPIFVAIGFITGKILTIPLLVGVFSKYLILEPLHTFAFAHITNDNFLLAFFSGMVLQGALLSFVDVPALLMRAYKAVHKKVGTFSIQTNTMQQIAWYAPICIAVLLIPFFAYFGFSLLAQLYILIGTIICIYQLIIIAGKIGLAPLGRFATFVMVPGLLFFGFNGIQATIVATFVEVSGGVAVDALFGRKMGQLAAIDRRYIVWFQMLGVVVAALSIGAIFIMLISHLGLQTPELFAQRAQSRAVLINAYSFDYYVMACGALFAFALKYFKINSVLVLGGLAMSVDVSLLLVLGGVMAMCVKDPEEYYSFWSGVFSASSLWMVLKTLF